MKWLTEPMADFKGIGIITAGLCCADRTYAGECRWYLECNGTGTLIIRPPV